MDFFTGLREIWTTAILWWAGLCVAFLVLTKFCPCNPGQNWWTNRRAALTDFFYWMLSPLINQLGRVVFLIAGVMILYGSDANPDFAVRRWPLWVQCIVILLLQDVMMYWIHRLFHTSAGWKFHAVHHSPVVVDWTSTVRFHPINAIGEFAIVDVTVLLMGFDPIALAILGPVNMIYSVMVHANLNWTFGPLKYIFASPVFHRWHHTSEEEGLDRNFAPTFPFLDYFFGTFYMPVGKRPEAYGVKNETLPAGFVGQTVYPFRGTGKWAMRHPIIATTCVLACASLGYYGWQKLTTPVPVMEIAKETDPMEIPPELLKLSPAIPKENRPATSVVANAAGSRVIFGHSDGTVSIRDAATDKELAADRLPSRVNALAISPNGWLAAAASGDGTAKVFDTSKGTVIRTIKHDVKEKCLMGIAISDDGWVATGALDGNIRLWNAEGECVKQRGIEVGSIQALAISDHGCIVVAAQGSDVSVWNTTTSNVTSCKGLKDMAYCIGIRKDGQRIAAGEYDGRLHVWDLGQEQPRTVAKGHTGPIYSVGFSPDGSSILTGGADKIVRLWNAENGSLKREFDRHSGLIFAVSFDETRQRILAAGKDRALTGWTVVNEGIVPVSGIER